MNDIIATIIFGRVLWWPGFHHDGTNLWQLLLYSLLTAYKVISQFGSHNTHLASKYMLKSSPFDLMRWNILITRSCMTNFLPGIGEEVILVTSRSDLVKNLRVRPKIMKNLNKKAWTARTARKKYFFTNGSHWMYFQRIVTYNFVLGNI